MFWNKLRLPKEWIQSWEDYLKYSPDALRLSRRLYHRVFIPDEMMSANPSNHHIGSQSAKIKLGFITQDKFSFLKRQEDNDIKGIPFREPIPQFPHAPIRGEMYAIKTDWLIELDNYKENGVLFNRERVVLRIPHHKQDKKSWDQKKKVWIVHAPEYSEYTIAAWMYVGNMEYWNSVLSKGIVIKSNTDGVSLISEDAIFSSVKTFIPHNSLLEEYYYFTPHEYNVLKFTLDTSASTMPGLRKYRRTR